MYVYWTSDNLTKYLVLSTCIYLRITSKSGMCLFCKKIVTLNTTLKVGPDYVQWRIQDFSKGAPTYYLTILFEKLHKIEEILAHGGVRGLGGHHTALL